jgi:hypothetical protein
MLLGHYVVIEARCNWYLCDINICSLFFSCYCYFIYPSLIVSHRCTYSHAPFWVGACWASPSRSPASTDQHVSPWDHSRKLPHALKNKPLPRILAQSAHAVPNPVAIGVVDMTLHWHPPPLLWRGRRLAPARSDSTPLVARLVEGNMFERQ